MILDRFLSQDKNGVLQEVSTVQFEVTNRCNLRCSICWRALKNEQVPPRDVTLSGFKTAIDKLLSVFPIKRLNTQGLGEPLLCPELLGILKYAKSKDIQVWFVTNGTLIDEFKAEAFVKMGIDKIRVSVDSCDAREYARIKRGSRLKRVMRGVSEINRFKKNPASKPFLAINAVVFKENLHSVGGLIEMAREWRVTEVSLIPMVIFSTGIATFDQHIDFYSQDFLLRFKRWKERAQELAIDLNLGVSLESREEKFCRFGIYVDVYGFIHPCCNIYHVNFGNIYRQAIKDIVRRYTRFRRWVDKEDLTCRRCNERFDHF